MLKITNDISAPKDYTIDGMYVYEDFESGLMTLQKPLLIYTQAFNSQFGFGRETWLAFITRPKTALDGSSIPIYVSAPLLLNPRDKRLEIAGAGHDDLYRHQTVELFFFDKEKRELGKPLGSFAITQKDADDFYYDKIRYSGLDIIRSYILYQGLRKFGHHTFNKYKKLNSLSYDI